MEFPGPFGRERGAEGRGKGDGGRGGVILILITLS